MTTAERTLIIRVLETLRTVPRERFHKRAIIAAVRTAVGFNWRYCGCCEDYIPPRYWHKNGEVCAHCACLRSQLKYWRAPERHREIARRSRAKRPPQPWRKAS